MANEEQPDPTAVLQITLKLSGLYAGALTSLLVGLGVRLGLYASLRDAGLTTPGELADRTGLHERWLREWLQQQAAAGIVEYGGEGRFELSREAAVLLADPEHLRYMGHSFESFPYRVDTAKHLPESFRTGIGHSWDFRGAEGALYTELTFRNWHRQVLVSQALPLLDGVVSRLESGAKVADVGCGSGIALIEMAKAFPRSQFHGYETSVEALARAQRNKVNAGVSTVSFHNCADSPLPEDGSFDLITTMDCLHDLTDPAQVAKAVRAAIKPAGAWFIIDIRGAPTFDENLGNPLSALLYAMSVTGCLSSGLSEEGGAGLGTLGLPEPTMREFVSRAGFTRFRQLDLPNPMNAYYEARP